MFKGSLFKLLSLIAIFFATTFNLQAASFKKANFEEKYIKFELPTVKNRDKVARTLTVAKVKGNDVYAYANKKQLANFEALGYNYEILTNPGDLNSKNLTMATTIEQMADWDRYPTYEVMTEMMEKMVIDYPDICKLENIGQSQQGRNLWVLKISDNVNIEENEPEFLYTGQMHGDEIVDYMMFLRLADYLLNNYGTDDLATELINNVEIWINPLSNPDGTYTDDNNDISGARRYLANNVDFNRNFPDIEDGDHPDGNAWAQETVSMINFSNEHNFVMSANSHSGAVCINYPWDTIERLHADNDWFYNVSRNYADNVHANSTGYMTDFDDGITNGYAWYSISGSRQDYMNYFQSCREITFELSQEKMLSSDELPAHWNYNKQAMMKYVQECLFGVRGIVSAADGNTVEAKITVLNHDKDNSEIYSDPDIGDYYRLLAPGTYDLEFSAEGYETVIKNDIVVTDNNTTTLNVVLPALVDNEAPEVSDLTGTTAQTGANMNISVDVYDVHQIEFVKAEYTVSGTTNTITLSEGKSGEKPSHVYTGTIPAQSSEISGTLKILTKDNQGNEGVSEIFTISWIDVMIDSFESGDFTFFDWSLEGDANWTIDQSTTPHSGSKSAKSGAIGNNQNSDIILNLNFATAGNIKFFKKVSSEPSYDKLKFYIDDTEKGVWSGEVDWSEENYALTAGEHNLKWEYSKDVSNDNGNDCAWIDDVEIIGLSSPEDTDPPIVTNFSGNTVLEGHEMQLSLEVSDASGVVSPLIGTYSIGGNSFEVEMINAKENYTFTGTIPAQASATTGTISFKVTDTAPAANNYISDSYDITWGSSGIEALIPEKTELYQNYPNPFNPATSIKFFNKIDAVVKLTVFNAKGETVAVLVDGFLKSNFHNITFNASHLNSGLYYYKLETKEKSITKKMMLIK